MSFSRIKPVEKCNKAIEQFKGKTEMVPISFVEWHCVVSLEETGAPNPAQYDQEGQEFNRYTLTGEYDPLFSALVRRNWLKMVWKLMNLFDEQYIIKNVNFLVLLEELKAWARSRI